MLSEHFVAKKSVRKTHRSAVSTTDTVDYKFWHSHRVINDILNAIYARSVILISIRRMGTSNSDTLLAQC